jgi:hypothetical protein
MDKLGEYQYPNLSGFSEALQVAEDALNRYGGVMPNLDVAQKLGYKVKNPAGIPGYVYKRFDDMCVFGLFQRERGGVRTTDLAVKALDPYDQTKSRDGLAKAIRNVEIIGKAFDEWRGVVPDDTAFPAKLAALTGVEWVEAKKHVEGLRRLFTECFPYLKTTGPPPMKPQLAETQKAGSEVRSVAQPPLTTGATGGPYGEVRTTMGTIVIGSKATLNLARNLLDILEDEIAKVEAEEKKSAKSKKVANDTG